MIPYLSITNAQKRLPKANLFSKDKLKGMSENADSWRSYPVTVVFLRRFRNEVGSLRN